MLIAYLTARVYQCFTFNYPNCIVAWKWQSDNSKD